MSNQPTTEMLRAAFLGGILNPFVAKSLTVDAQDNVRVAVGKLTDDYLIPALRLMATDSKWRTYLEREAPEGLRQIEETLAAQEVK